MATSRDNQNSTQPDPGRRRLLGAAGAGMLASALGVRLGAADEQGSSMADAKTLRWGVVGTGGIANRMAPMIRQAKHAVLAAVSSRRMETADEFADEHGVEHRFDSWEDLCRDDRVDAIYVATPTIVREEICIAAANAGKHVLGEKPFASLPSLQRITAACRANGVGFMDGTHFVHHPRTAEIRRDMERLVGWPWSVASAFQFGIGDPDNIRLNPDLEPYGAIGDAGWSNMRAAVEYLAPDAGLVGAETRARRGGRNDAVVAAGGILSFDDGSTSTWDCGFESGAVIMDLRISGASGVLKLDDFVLNFTDPAVYEQVAGWGRDGITRHEVAAGTPAAARMFEDFAAMAGRQDLVEASIRASERTQELLDAAWKSAVG